MTTLTGTLGAHALAATVAAGSVNTVPAAGALKLSWLLIAFPLFGAAVLLLGGRRTNRCRRAG
jgi:NADH-quinone oxidoreductase subunit L